MNAIFFARMRRWRDWTVIVGEAVAVISATLSFVPGLPGLFGDLGIPIAVVIGSLALLTAAVFDKMDPTKPVFVVGTEPIDEDLLQRLPDGATYVQRER